jgi:hypothetical protein
MEEGYRLDWVYCWSIWEGEPHIYVRAESQKSYANYKEYSTGNEQSGEFEEKIRIDGTAEGFFEYVVLEVIGQQFYRYWHATRYNDWQIICTADRLNEVIEDNINTGFGTAMSSETAEAARKLDINPVIDFKGDKVTVSVLVFTIWDGFQRLNYTIKREYPHTITHFSFKTLVEYNCGVIM